MAVSCGEYLNGELGEIFLDFSKEGTFGKVMMQAFAMSVSLGLQHGISLPTFISAFKTLEMDPDFIRLLFEELNKIYVLRLKWPDLE